MSMPYEFRYARLVYMRWFLAAPILAGLIGLSTSYLARGVQSASTQPLLARFDEVPGLWPLVFGVPCCVLIGALIAKRYIAQAYVLAATAFWLYGVALILGAFLAHSSWAAASMSMSLCLQSVFLAKTYAKGR